MMIAQLISAVFSDLLCVSIAQDEFRGPAAVFALAGDSWINSSMHVLATSVLLLCWRIPWCQVPQVRQGGEL